MYLYDSMKRDNFTRASKYWEEYFINNNGYTKLRVTLDLRTPPYRYLSKTFSASSIFFEIFALK